MNKDDFKKLILSVCKIKHIQFTNILLWLKKPVFLVFCCLSLWFKMNMVYGYTVSWVVDGPEPSYFYHHINESKTKEQALAECNNIIRQYDPFHTCHNAGSKYLGYQATGGWVSANGDPHQLHLATNYYPTYFGVFETGESCPVEEGDPCSPASGVMTRKEVDYKSQDGTLKIVRSYSSHGISDGFNRLGYGWRNNYTYRLNGYGGWESSDYAGTRTASYLSPSDACTQGWSGLKSNYHFLTDSVANYNCGICEIIQNDVVVAYLQIRNTRNTLIGYASTAKTLSLKRSGSNTELFYQESAECPFQYPTTTSLEASEEGWIFSAENGTIESYDEAGKLVRRKDSNGIETSFAYDEEDRLSVVTGHFGKTLSFHYDDNDRLVTITTPDGDINYGYDTKGRLSNVVNIDGSERLYHYESFFRTNALTGVTDENGVRVATWAYDMMGRAISAEHADGIDRVTFTYNNDGTTQVRDAVGATRVYHFQPISGDIKVIQVDGDRCATCSHGGIKSYTYDDNGFTTSKTDWNGNTTTYTRDSQGRELTRTEAAGTPQARTITTTWDATLNKPLTVTEPEQRTVYTYDTEGRLLSRQQSPIQ